MKSLIKFGQFIAMAGVPVLIVFGLFVTFSSVPPTTKGKVLTTAGYSPEILEPGKYTLWGRDSMILLETNTNTFNESVDVVLADKLMLKADVRFRGRIGGSDKILNMMFNDVRAGDDRRVSFNEVYAVYGRMVVRNKTREIISTYTVEEVHKNYARISKEIAESVSTALKTSPLELSDIALGSIAYPTVVTDAINAAKERDLAIIKEQAQAKIDLTRKENERLLAEANYQVEITNAKAVRDSNKIIGEGITPELIELRRLDVLSEMATNKNAVFMPVEGMTSPGAQVRMYSK